eukprot:CAMPEP_0168734944 /NCGR_PEP_ID=MMETSP0724-20121128/9078_1 /TAXON_ID=265536 /ORGANISM="Amphiprora sp., Strain CCMP467" /LENGTH=346 /DNA_ID=CAMNT_0008782071 /DNA_START=42 /DNA_END=1082 /DNA_ORIENTATION=+
MTTVNVSTETPLHSRFISMVALVSVFSARFTNALAPTAVSQDVPHIKPIHSQELGVPLENLHDLFGQIQEVSPLARKLMQSSQSDKISPEAASETPLGFAGLDTNNHDPLKWKTVESRKGGPVWKIEKCDSYNGQRTPLLRFRSTLSGPCVGEYFGKYILDLSSRQKWDKQIDTVYPLYEMPDLDAANLAMGSPTYGDVARLGIGYGTTKKGLGISPREQCFWYGLQEFPCGSSILWGTEVDDEHNAALLPNGGKLRHQRARSHLFAATLTPTGADTFDVEYVLQLDIGGGLPHFVTTPVLIDTVKSLFRTAHREYSKLEGEFQAFLEEWQNRDHVASRHSLLMTP